MLRLFGVTTITVVIMVVTLLLGVSVTSAQAYGNGIGDCQTISIAQARDIFRHLDGTSSLRREWKRVSSGELEHFRGPKVRGVVPDNHFVVGRWSSKWNLEGKLIVKKRFSLWCIPDSGTHNTDQPPLTCPATVDDAVFIYGGKAESWSGGIPEGSRTLRYWGAERLGAFTVPWQAFVLAKKPSSGAWYYTPGDSVRPSQVLEITCWR